MQFDSKERATSDIWGQLFHMNFDQEKCCQILTPNWSQVQTMNHKPSLMRIAQILTKCEILNYVYMEYVHIYIAG